MVRRCAGNHDHGGDAAEARKGQAFDHLFVSHDFVSPGLQLAVDALDPERMPECHRFASRPRQDQLPRIGADLRDSMTMNRFCALSPAFVANRLFAAREYSPASGAFGEHRLRLRLLRPNSHGFLFKPGCAPVALRSDTPDRYSRASRDGL